jgi:hypothetical protein
MTNGLYFRADFEADPGIGRVIVRADGSALSAGKK